MSWVRSLLALFNPFTLSYFQLRQKNISRIVHSYEVTRKSTFEYELNCDENLTRASRSNTGTLLGEVYGFATHPYGCRVIQRILEYCSDMKETKELMKEIETASLALMQDQYGNYVIQWMIEKGERTQRERLVNRVRGNVLRFSQHKYASNVVECCLQHGTTSQRHDLVKEILNKDEAGIAPLELMIKDPFANYVVQRILDVVDDRQRIAVVNVIQSHAAHLKRFTYGKHILSKVSDKKYGGNDSFMAGVKKM